VIATDWVF